MKLKGTKIGPYEIVEELGCGGMGRVLKAYEWELGRYVAIKMMFESLSNESTVVERFLREARAMAQLTDPHIVQIYTVGMHEDQPYFAMELVEGETLAAKIRREGQLSLPAALEITAQVAMGLAHAHEKGVIHRDIKPSNILLSKRGLVKVADFGIAMSIQEEATRLTGTGQSIGTPGYMSPELCMGHPISAASDIFSLGVVLFEMLTGKLPVQEESPLGIIREIVNFQLPDLQALCPGLDPLADRILRKMLERDSTRRYQSCRELLDDLLSHPAVGLVKFSTAPLTSGIAKGQSLEAAQEAASPVGRSSPSSGGAMEGISREPTPGEAPLVGTSASLPEAAVTVAQSVREQGVDRDRTTETPAVPAAAMAATTRKSWMKRFVSASVLIAAALPFAIGLAVLLSRHELFASSSDDGYGAGGPADDGGEEGFLARIWPWGTNDERNAKAKELSETFTPVISMGASAVLDPSNPSSPPKLIGHADMRITAQPRFQQSRTRKPGAMKTVALLAIGEEVVAAPFVQGFKDALQHPSIKVVEATQLADLTGLLDPQRIDYPSIMKRLSPKAQGLGVVVSRRGVKGEVELNMRFVDLRDGREPVGDLRRTLAAGSAAEGSLDPASSSWFDKVREQIASAAEPRARR